jgi:general secretion pathway protein F
MAKFVYEVKSSPSERTKGVITAESRNAAINKLLQMGYTLISVYDEKEFSQSESSIKASFSSRIKSREVTDFIRKLSDLLESGFPISKALSVLARQARNKAMKDVILNVSERCDAGETLSSALGRYPKIFSQLYTSMVRAGETGGKLNDILKRLADFSENQADTRAKLRSALAYPVFMLVVGIVTVILLLAFVIPKMTAMFSDMDQALPLPTTILLAISDVFKNYWWALIAVFVGLAVAFKNIYSSQKGRLAIDRAKLKIWIFGRFETQSEIARFVGTLGNLMRNGIPILEALKISFDTIGNTAIRQEISKAYTSVKEGTGLAKGLDMSTIVPEDIVSMVALGEESGGLDKSLLKIAQRYERETAQTINMIMSLMEPVIILIMGSIVGFIVISMLLPIFEVNFLVR